MAKGLGFVLRLMVVLFPLVTGVFLTNYGIDKLNEAYIFSKKPWTAPYGFLVFSSMPMREVDAHFWLESVSVKDNAAEVCLSFHFYRIMDQSVTGEQVIGFQIPYVVQLQSLDISVGPEQLPVPISDQETIFIEEPPSKPPAEENIRTTIIYLKLTASSEDSEYHGDIFFTWEGLIVRESFSTYALTIPFANSEGTAHKKIPESFPNAYIYAVGMRIVVGLSLPEGSEFRGSITPPNTELVEAGLAMRKLLWSFENRPIMGFRATSSNLVVNLELQSEAELRDRLLFDSGLYMGLGVSLIFSGIYEALKTLGEINRSRKIKV